MPVMGLISFKNYIFFAGKYFQHFLSKIEKLWGELSLGENVKRTP